MAKLNKQLTKIVDELLQGIDDAEIRITIPQSLTIISMGYQTGNVDDNEVKKDIREVVELAFQVRGYDVHDENVEEEKKRAEEYLKKREEKLKKLKS